MPVDTRIKTALVEAAEAIYKRKLTGGEGDDLVDRFNRATGTGKERAKTAIRAFGNLTEAEYGVRQHASDNSDRKVKDLENLLDPGQKR